MKSSYLVSGSRTYKIKYNKADNSLIGERVEATSTYKSKEQVVARVEPKPTEPPTEAPSEESTGSAFDDLESIFDSILDGI